MSFPEHMQIPEMVHPLGKHWEQPKRSEILMQEKYVKMSTDSFKKLHEYSMSIPTGKYVGKMWRSRKGEFWFLNWYAANENPKYLTIHSKRILSC